MGSAFWPPATAFLKALRVHRAYRENDFLTRSHTLRIRAFFSRDSNNLLEYTSVLFFGYIFLPISLNIPCIEEFGVLDNNFMNFGFSKFVMVGASSRFVVLRDSRN